LINVGDKVICAPSASQPDFNWHPGTITKKYRNKDGCCGCARGQWLQGYLEKHPNIMDPNNITDEKAVDIAKNEDIPHDECDKRGRHAKALKCDEIGRKYETKYIYDATWDTTGLLRKG